MTEELGDKAIDTYKLLDELELVVEDSPKLFGALLLDKDLFFELTNKIRASLPDELRKANRVNQESDRIVGGARETAEQTVSDAQLEARRVAETSQQQAERMLREAETKAQQRLQEVDALAQKTVAEARAVAQQVTQDARQTADRLLAESAARAEHLVSENEILRVATAQAREIISGAEHESRDIRKGADEFAREELARMERELSDSLTIVQRGRGKLDQRLGVVDAPPQSTTRPSSAEFAGSRR